MRLAEPKKLVFGGRIYTVEEGFPLADAMMVEGDRITWIGSSRQLSAVPSDSYRMIDLNGKIVLPGFIDSHMHLYFWALSRGRIDLDGATSYEQALKIVQAFASKMPPRERGWVIGKGWKKEQWKKMRWPHKSDLDSIFPNRPVAIFSKDEHLLWVNSVALRKTGVSCDTPDPEGGQIDHDQNGEPNGILRDQAASLVSRLYQSERIRNLEKILTEGFQEMFRVGCLGCSSFDSIDGWEALQSLDVAGKLPVKVAHYFRDVHLDQVLAVRLKSGSGSEFLKVGGIKIFADGALGSQTALMLRPFEGTGNNAGIEVTSASELRRLISNCNRAGLACAIHAIGDLANRQVLDGFDTAGLRKIGRFRNRVEHCQIVSPADLKRYSRLNLIASMQPSHATADIDLMRLYLGKRQKDSYRFRSLLRAGVSLTFGSDAPIEPLDPLGGIYAAVTGKRPGCGECYNSRETISVTEAVRGFTIGGAMAAGEAEIRGSLKVGKKADFVILDRDIMRLEAEQILKTKVAATFVNGKVMYSRDGFRES